MKKPEESLRRGFTLLELIVTIVILAILAALAIPSFAKVINKSQDETTRVTLQAMARESQALQAFGDPYALSVISAVEDTTFKANSAGTYAASPYAAIASTVAEPLPGEVVYVTTSTGVVLSMLSGSGNICVIGFDSSVIGKSLCVEPGTASPSENTASTLTGGPNSVLPIPTLPETPEEPQEPELPEEPVIYLPGMPTDMNITPGINKLSVSWNAPVATDVPLTGYRLELNPGNITLDLSTTSHTFLNLDSSVAYSVSLQSLAEGEKESAETILNATPLRYVGAGNSTNELALTGQQEVYVPTALYPYNILGDGENIYFAGGHPNSVEGGVFLINEGGVSAKLYSQTGAAGLTRIDDYLYSISQNNTTLKRYSLIDGTVKDLPGSIAGRSLATDGVNLYATSATGLYTIDPADGKATRVMTGNYYALTYDGANAFYIGSKDGKLIKRNFDPNAAPGSQWGTQVDLARAGDLTDNPVWAAVISGQSIYFSAERSGAVFKAPLAGGTAVLVQGGFAQPVGLATDGTSLFLGPFGSQKIIRLY